MLKLLFDLKSWDASFKSCVLLFIFLSSFTFYSQVNPTSKNTSFQQNTVTLDSALNWLKKTRFESDPHFTSIAQSIAKRAVEKKEYYYLGRIHGYISNWYYLNNTEQHSDSIIVHQKIAIAYYEKAKDLDAVNEMYLGLAMDYINNDEFTKAEEVTLKAIHYFEETDNQTWLAEARAQIAALYLVTKQPKKVIEYAQLSYPILLKNKEFLVGCSALRYASDAYRMLKDYDSALTYADQCIQLIKVNSFNQDKDLLVATYETKGKIYADQNEYDNALIYFNKAWQENITLSGKESADFFRFNIGNTLLKQHKYEAALPHLIAGINAKQHSKIEKESRLYLALSTCYEKLGNYNKALENRDIAMALNTGKYEEKINLLQSEMILKYETSKKDEALAAQTLLLSQKNKVQRLVIGIAILLLALLFLLFYYLRKNKKTTLIISQKNDEKELLLKEIHHRVKNNLELVKSLISLQAAQLEDSATKDAMIASQNRVQSMGIIHQKLYQGTNLGAIEMKDYFVNLGEGILDAFAKTDKVKIECAMNQLDLDVDTAVPIGLIVNELLTNALKYAFPNEKKGTIKIKLSKTKNDFLSLAFSDNGVGKNNKLNAKGTGFGSQLINLLTQQLNGHMTTSYTTGTSYVFQFKGNKAA